MKKYITEKQLKNTCDIEVLVATNGDYTLVCDTRREYGKTLVYEIVDIRGEYIEGVVEDYKEAITFLRNATKS